MPAKPSLLVVENDPGLREAVALVLSQEGYEIILAASGSGEEALAIMADVEALDGLYTDIELARAVTGWVVGQAFSVLWPARPIVYASGQVTEPPVVGGDGIFLRKPFELAALCGAFRQRSS